MQLDSEKFYLLLENRLGFHELCLLVSVLLLDLSYLVVVHILVQPISQH